LIQDGRLGAARKGRPFYEKNEGTMRTVPAKQIQLVIEKIDSQGDGIARDGQGKIVFVPGALPEETVLANISTEKKDYCTAHLVKVLKPHPERVVPVCPLHGKCGGCQIQHVSYPFQLRLKLQMLTDAFSRNGRQVPFDGFEPVRPSPLIWSYRNKISLPVGGGKGLPELGYYRKKTHRIVPVDHCPVALAGLNGLLSEIRKSLGQTGLIPYDERTGKGTLRHVVLRGGQETGELLVVLVLREFPASQIVDRLIALARRIRKRYPSLAGFVLNLNPSNGNAIFGPITRGLSGRTFFFERFGEMTFRFEATSFSQVNTSQAVRLYETAAGEACPAGGEKILELYAGVGTLTCFLAARASSVVAVEEWKPSVDCLRENAGKNGLSNVKIAEAPAERFDFQTVGTSIDTVVLDPPRSGCHPAVLESLIRIGAKRLVYVSCNPATLARDVRLLCQNDFYRLRKVIPFDLFPQTSHVESVAVLEGGIRS
jgi:23S rRNA (uracil1939-C5)-methyltransferase